MEVISTDRDSVLGDYVLQLQKQKEERERRRREIEEEMERQRKAEEARRIAEEVRRHKEEERKRKEEEDRKRAKEAQILAAKQAELRRQERKKIAKVCLVILAIGLLVFGGVKVAKVIAHQRALTLTNEIVEQADALIATYQFDEAHNICENELKKMDSEEARRIVLAKKAEITSAKNKADAEYESALGKLKILLDADDNVFNQYSNEFLNKMIEIYPERKETIYYKSLRK